MELIPLLRFWRDIRTGANAAAIVALGFTAWRLTREHSLGWSLLALSASTVAFGGLLGLYLQRWVPKHWKKATAMPADAQVLKSRTARTWALLGGLGFGLAAVGKGADDRVIVSSV